MELDLENGVVSDERSESCQTMTAGAPVSDEQSVAFRQLDDSVYFTDIVDRVLKQNDVHLLGFALFVVLL